jgi:hypothetical protein
VIILIIGMIVYTFLAVALCMWGLDEKPFDIWTMAALLAFWPVTMPVGYLYGFIRLEIKWRRYRGNRYLRKTFNAAAIDEHIAKYGS